MDMTVEVKDFVAPELRRLLKKARDLRPAMRRIESTVLSLSRGRAWAESGLQSRSGELQGAIKTWSGKKSAGVSVKKPAGRNLVLPKAVTHSEGRKKHQFRLKLERAVRAHTRAGSRVSRHMRKNLGGPRGDITARPFLPTGLNAGEQQQVVSILEGYLDVRP